MNIRIFVSKFLRKYFLFIKGKKYDLIILDDLLPVHRSPWRNCEYDGLLSEFHNSKVIADLTSYYRYNDHLSYDENLFEIGEKYPVLALKIKSAKIGTSINAKLVYTLFYRNIVRYYKLLIERKINYGFTLYPGGGFVINDKECDGNLLKIINNQYCKFVFVNQQYSYNYLTKKLKISPNKVHLFLGGPLTFDLTNFQIQRKFENGNTNIVFMASKYMPFGLDKGFDVFQNVVLELKERQDIHFHVVGNFTKNDILYSEIEAKINFHGHLNEQDFAKFFSNKDIIISPNRSNTLSNGAFDGFPMGSVVTAGTFGCAMMLTNELNESPDVFIDGIHYIKIAPNHKDIVNKVLYILDNKDIVKSLVSNAKKKISEVFDADEHLKLRINVIKQFL